MGYIRHDAIVVTIWDIERLKKVHEKAKELGLPVSEIVKSPSNGYCSFLIAPDGSKEGREDSEKGEQRRAEWIAWAKASPDLYLDWVHINYGGDDSERITIVDHAGNYPEE